MMMISNSRCNLHNIVMIYYSEQCRCFETDWAFIKFCLTRRRFHFVDIEHKRKKTNSCMCLRCWWWERYANLQTQTKISARNYTFSATALPPQPHTANWEWERAVTSWYADCANPMYKHTVRCSTNLITHHTPHTHTTTAYVQCSYTKTHYIIFYMNLATLIYASFIAEVFRF